MKYLRMRLLPLALLLPVLFGAGLRGDQAQVHGWDFVPAGPVIRALESITAQSLRGRLSFLASDTLEGRPTPSAGQDVAAEYIAAEFRRAGLETVGEKDYFQTVLLKESRPDRDSFRCRISIGAKEITVPPDRFSMNAIASLELDQSPIVIAPLETRALEGMQTLDGKVLVAVTPPETAAPDTARPPGGDFYRRAGELGPRLIVVVRRSIVEEDGYFDRPQLLSQTGGTASGASRRPLVATINDASLAEALSSVLPEVKQAALSLRIRERPPAERPLRNVAGLLRGFDPALRDSYELLTAHYDGTGPRAGSSRDRIWNAANDNASGTAAVIEVAAALSALPEKPRRSILFVCFFGEEKGMLGSRHYGSNPLVPIDKTVAAVNLEQVGRTDATEGDQAGKANVTGYDYSEVGTILRLAGERMGIKVFKNEKFSDFYFMASDNIALARLGVPAHTLSVSYQFPDYHGAGDHWERLDLANMERVVRTVALALLFIAQSDRVPRWDATNPRAERFAKAREQLQPK